MEKLLLIRFGEIFLKGENRGWFERKLAKNLSARLSAFGGKLEKIQGRYLYTGFSEGDTDRAVDRVKKTFGVHSVSVAVKVPTDLQSLKETADAVLPPCKTFKVETHRADKKFPLTSMEISREVGGYLLSVREGLSVDVVKPQRTVHIDLRETGESFLFSEVEPAERGMPYGTSGKGVCLLSGGIDSPVACYQMAKRGMETVLLHFHSYPYTSDMARGKVEHLAKLLAAYTGPVRMHVVSVTEIQESIHDHCRDSMLITLLRRFMMRIANRICAEEGALGIVTGESLAQVASQTLESMYVTNAVAEFPVLRPLVGTDKQDIIEVARKIGTYETSVQPYEDCCTVFLPKNPVTKPRLEQVLAEEAKLDVEGLLSRALGGKESILIV